VKLSLYYRNYKRLFFLGMCVFITLTTLGLASVHLLLGIFGLVLALGGMCGLAYLDLRERKALEEDLVLSSEPKKEAAVSSTRPRNSLVVAFLQVDDYDRVFQELSDEERPLLVAAVDRFLKEWASSHKGFLQKEGRDRYLLLLDVEELKRIEDEDFSVLEEVKGIKLGNALPVTLSIGVGKDAPEGNLAVLGELAREALELALVRGGDQAIVKAPHHTWFYWGKSLS